MSPVVFDLDDLCDDLDPWFVLHDLKELWPGLKVTMFAIPGRCSPQLLEKYGNLDWVELGVHGYHHSTMECAVWSKEEAENKLVEVDDWWPGVKVFKAPGWVKNTHVDKALYDNGWIIADHIAQAPDWSNSPAHRYVYNAQDKVLAIHGHTWDTCDNGPTRWLEMFAEVGDDPEFQFVSDVAEVFDSGDELQDEENSWSHKSVWGEHSAKNFLTFLAREAVSKGSVADFGGNDGLVMSIAKKRGLTAINIDSDPKRCWFSRAIHGVETIQADLTDIPLEDNSVDWGYSSHTLEHVDDFDKALAEIKRICRIGCFFVLPIENEDQFAGNPAHKRRNTMGGWAEQLGTYKTTSTDDPGVTEFTGVWKK